MNDFHIIAKGREIIFSKSSTLNSHLHCFHLHFICTYENRNIYSYRSAVLNHGVLHLMSLGNATGEEAALANVIVKMFQTPISVERKRKRRNEVKKAKEEE